MEFDKQINAIFDNVPTSTPADFTRTLDILRTTAQGNELITIYSSN